MRTNVNETRSALYNISLSFNTNLIATPSVNMVTNTPIYCKKTYFANIKEAAIYIKTALFLNRYVAIIFTFLIIHFTNHISRNKVYLFYDQILQ